MAFSTDKGLITPKKNEYTQVEATLNGIEFSLFDFEQLNDNEDILKVMMIDPEDHLTKVIEQLPDYLQEKYSCARSTPYFYEFMNPKSHKGFGIAALAKYLNLSADEIICVGDGGNDKQMIEFAGLGVAMENAVDDVKSIAQHITSSNDEDGVAKVIEDFILGNKLHQQN
jgi:Cof subfamily protein (haloacid dehalogenase superfamily)